MNDPQYLDPEEAKTEEAVINFPTLALDMDDKSLLHLINTRIKEDKDYYDKINLDKRRKILHDYWKGNQLDESQMEPWQLKFVDNLIWQDLETRISIAAAKMPDITVIPPVDDPVSRERALKIEKALDIRINNENIRRLIKDGLRDNNLDLIGVLKVYWDPNRGKNGDYTYDLVNPKKISMDHTATIPHDGYSADNMETIYEWLEEPVAVVCAKFPNKAAELKKLLNIELENSPRLASKMKYLEVWFTSYDKDGKPIEGVCWKYQNLILDKVKNPYYDWSGVQKPNGKTPKTTFKNFFDMPRKPYIFFNYQNLGESPIDDTSPAEQSIPIQRAINKRGRQITEISDNAVPKKVFSGNFITKDEARKVSQDPNESVWLDKADDVNKAFTTINAAPPSPLLFQDLISLRGQVDAKFATHGITRGESVAPQQSGISKQITRQGDLQIADDVVEITVVRVISEIAGWSLQMMKSMYTEEHDLKSVGKDGEVTTLSVDQTLIDDGIGLQVKASTTDRTKRSADALQLTSAKTIDPLSLYEDMDVPNPKERAKRLITFLMGQMDGFQSYQRITELDKDPNLNPAQESNIAGLGKEEAIQDIQSIKEGKPIESQGLPSEEYVRTFMEFVNSGEFNKLDPQIQQRFIQHINELKAKVAQKVPPQQPQQAPMQAPMQQM